MSLAAYSDFMVAVRRDIYLKCQLLQNIPAVLARETAHHYVDAVYLGKDSMLWHLGNDDVAAILYWLAWLEDEVENPPAPVERFRDSKNSPVFEDKIAFGAILLNESGETQTWGEPAEYDLGVSHIIKTPY
jgi:hypothetical protein